MNTKQMLIIITIIALLVIGLGWYLSETNEAQAPEIVETVSTTTIDIPTDTRPSLPELAGIALRVPDSQDTTATITAETSTTSESTLYSASFGETEEGFIAVVDNRFTQIDDTYFVVPFAVSEGGSGTFSYLALLKQNDEQVIHVDSVLLGNQIRITGLAVEDVMVTTETKERFEGQEEGEEPEISVSYSFDIREDTLMLVSTHKNIAKEKITLTAFFNPDTSSIIMSGSAPTNWFFEGDFPVKISNQTGEILATGFVTTQGQETGTDEVSFDGEIMGVDYSEEDIWYITLTKDNPSDDRSLDANYTTRL